MNATKTNKNWEDNSSALDNKNKSKKKEWVPSALAIDTSVNNSFVQKTLKQTSSISKIEVLNSTRFQEHL